MTSNDLHVALPVPATAGGLQEEEGKEQAIILFKIWDL